MKFSSRTFLVASLFCLGLVAVGYAESEMEYPTDPEIERDLKEALLNVPAACGQLGMPSLLSLSVTSAVVAQDRIVGEASAQMQSSPPFGAPRTCDVQFAFRYIRTSRGWDFDGVKDAGSISTPAGATALDEARATNRPQAAPATANHEYPTDAEIQRDLKEALLSVPAACNQLGMPSLLSLSVTSVLAGEDSVVGEATAEMQSTPPFGAARNCNVELSFNYIRTSRGWSFIGIKDAGSIATPPNALPLADARAGAGTVPRVNSKTSPPSPPPSSTVATNPAESARQGYDEAWGKCFRSSADKASFELCMLLKGFGQK